MIRLKHLKAYEDKNVPDHIVQEVNDLSAKMLVAFQDVTKNVDSNLVLSALNRLHSLIIIHLVVDDPLHIRSATLCEAKTLIKNVEYFSKVDILKPDSTTQD